MKELINHREENWKSVEEASADVWQKYGPKNIHSYEDYLNAKDTFRESPQIEFMVRGGGPSALLITRQYLNIDPRVHVTILEKADRLGGMGINAISPFVDNHIDTIISQQRLIFQTVTDPRVDVITGCSVSESEIPQMAKWLRAQIVIDAAGTIPNKLEKISYSKFVMTSNDYLNYVNGVYNEDGNFGRVDVPVKRDASGKPYPTIVAAGGNQSRDLQKANELVILADRWARELGRPKEELDIAKVAKEGIRIARLKMGLPDDPDQETQILYRGLDWKMKKLLKGVGNLAYGDPKLREAMAAEIARWEEEDGGMYISSREIVDIKESEGSPLLVMLKDNETGVTYPVAAGNVITAIRFEERHELPNTVLIGIARKGAADLSTTGVEIVRETIPRIKEMLENMIPLTHREAAEGERTRNLLVKKTGDPVVLAMNAAPKYITALGFRRRES